MYHLIVKVIFIGSICECCLTNEQKEPCSYPIREEFLNIIQNAPCLQWNKSAT